MNQDGEGAGVLSAVAIVGMTGRFPGANDLETYWRNTCQGVESITFFRNEQLAQAGIDARVLSHPNYVKARGILEGIEFFDPAFFGYTPRGALVMDPQQRLFLECCWEALETAGYDPSTYRGLIGVYGGATTSSYQAHVYANVDSLNGVDGSSIAMGNDLTFLTTRVSYKLDLKGPSCPVQTACSTSLVAVHLACQGLLNAECDLALAGGVSIRIPQESGYLYQEEGIFSPDGHCRSFDASARGTVFSHGVGVVVLKRLEDALADRDFIHAVIRGSAINNDGSRKASFTAPGVGGQTEVVADALASAEVAPDTIGYVEAHGSGTPLGDSIEIQALTKAFSIPDSRASFCAIGSAKANIGHLDAAAGVAGLMRATLAVEHGWIPPSVHFERPNPDIHFEKTPFYVSKELKPWPTRLTPRRAGVSSFGFGGTNAHVILEEAPSLSPSDPPRTVELIALSARTTSALDNASMRLAKYLRVHQETDLADAAFTLQTGRRAFPHRRVVCCRNIDEAATALENGDPLRSFSGHHDSPNRPVVFMFSGQGSQYVNMGLELYDEEEAFRDALNECCDRLTPHLGSPLRDVMYPKNVDPRSAAERLTKTGMAQAALFAVEYALSSLWISWGIKPTACIGHSIGEYVAACLSGVLSLEDALTLVAARGRLMESMPAGVMLAVTMNESDIRELLHDRLWLSAVNGDASCVLSGTDAAVAELEARLEKIGVGFQRLHTSHAFHSGMLDAAVDPFMAVVRKTALGAPRIPYISNVTGTWITPSQTQDPAYWGRHIREPVRFADGISEIKKKGELSFLEIGPGHVLCTLVRHHRPGSGNHVVVNSMKHATDQGSDLYTLFSAVGKLWVSGVNVNWTAFHGKRRRRRIPLPTYPFERQRYWVDGKKRTARQSPVHRPGHDARVADVAEWLYVPSWRQSPLPLLRGRSMLVDRSKGWLIFLDESGFGERLAAKLRTAGQKVCTVGFSRSDSCRKGAADRSMDPKDSRAYVSLFTALLAEKLVPDVVLHLGAVDDIPEHDSQFTRASVSLDRGFSSALMMGRAIGDSAIDKPVRIGILSRGVHDVTGREELCPGNAAILGLSRVLHQEYPHLSCRNLDLSGSGSDCSDYDLDAVLNEMTSRMTDSVVAFRGGRRWVQSYQSLRENIVDGAPPLLRTDGAYLITGGMGEIGLEIAEFLVRSVHARLALIGRTPLPPIEKWDEALASPAAEPSFRRKLARLDRLKKLGAQILPIAADVGNKEQMRAAFDLAEKTFGAVHGVIHGAGLVAGDAFRPISETDEDVCRRQFHPKIAGLCVLDEIIRDRQLDFCILISSLSSILGGLRYAAYASANAFMDAFAYMRNRDSRFPWITTNWDSWLRTEDEARIKTANQSPAGYVMTPSEGVEAFRRILAIQAGPQVIVSTGDLQTRMDQWVRMEVTEESADAKKEDEKNASSRYPRPNLQTEYAAPQTELEQSVADIWQELLGVDRVGVNDNFFELGGDSFLGVQVIAKIKTKLGASVSAASLYEGPTVRSLARLMDSAGRDRKQEFAQIQARGERRRERFLQKQPSDEKSS